MNARSRTTSALLAATLAVPSFTADLPGSKDPAGLKRYTGSDLIAYRAPKLDEFLLPLGPPTQFSPASVVRQK
jgi:hypothetical protein